MKLVLLWLCCIALDLLIGFRFELLYPVWLLVRNCYDSFRFQGLVSSLQYSVSLAVFQDYPSYLFNRVNEAEPSRTVDTRLSQKYAFLSRSSLLSSDDNF